MWIGILFICQLLCQILLPWLVLPPDPSVLYSPLTAAAVNPAMALTQLSLCCLLAPCLIYPISKATLLQSLISHCLCLPTILRWWMIQVSKTRSMSIMVTHMWSLLAMVTWWDKVAQWQIWMKLSLCHILAPCLIYLISKATLPQSLISHCSHLPTIFRWWMMQLSKTRSMSIMVTHMWSLPAMVTQWDEVAWWQIWTKHSSWLSIMQGVVTEHQLT